MSLTIGHYLFVSATLFTLGLLGVILRRNILVIYMCLEMMLGAVALAFIAFSKLYDVLDGQIMVFFVITVAAAEVALGLAIIVAYYRLKQTTHIEDMNSMKF
ncbi:NADH-quinone oxidoreductase subunit NuoK [Kamptonema cortianum]|nr:NADH-quinone oxidoreductase subunit NuoK [Kamptonema cortianum]